MMKSSRRTWLVPVLVLNACVIAGAIHADDKKPPAENSPNKETTPNHDEIEWLRYDQGLKKAQEEEKHVFVDFSTSWCGWCKKMDRETFSDPKVINMLNDHFVSVKVDGDSRTELNIDGYKISERNLTRYEFGVRGFPAFWFLKPDGTKLAQIRGYRKADFMMEAFKFVKDRRYDSTAAGSTEKDESKK